MARIQLAALKLEVWDWLESLQETYKSSQQKALSPVWTSAG